MALDPSALCSLASARTYLQVDADELPKDELLELIIEGLSARITQRTGRLYVNPIAKDAKSEMRFDFDPSTPLVPISDVREVSQIRVSATPEEDDTWFTLGSSDYYLEPLNNPVTTAIRFLTGPELPAQGVGWGALSLHRNQPQADSMGTPWPWEGTRIAEARCTAAVEGKFGAAADTDGVPANVKLAIALWLQNLNKRDQVFLSDDFGKAVAGLKMPPDVEELLDGEPDTRPNVAVI